MGGEIYRGKMTKMVEKSGKYGENDKKSEEIGKKGEKIGKYRENDKKKRREKIGKYRENVQKILVFRQLVGVREFLQSAEKLNIMRALIGKSMGFLRLFDVEKGEKYNKN